MSMDRRQALKLMATASAGMWAPAHVVAARDKADAALARSAQGVAFVPEFFTDHEHATARVLVDLIIPADDRSGSATDAGVPEFMDFMMIDRPRMQEWMRGGLAWLDIECQRRFDRTFVDADGAQRGELLDAIAWPDRADDELSHGVAFFNRFRDLTASGFWSTEMGIADLQYSGNRMLATWTGCPDEALRHVGVLDADD
jgi:hypothetical protein